MIETSKKLLHRLSEPFRNLLNALTESAETRRAAINILTSFVLLTGLGVLSFLLPKQTVSLLERRTLASPPVLSASGLLTGSFTRSLDEYYADHFPGRDALVAFARSLDDFRGFRPDEVKIYGQTPATEAAPSPEASQPASENTPEASQPEQSEAASPPTEQNQADQQAAAESAQVDGTFIYRDTAYSLFGGNRRVAQYYAQVLNSYRQKLGDSVSIYNLVIPTSAEFGLPDRYRNLSNEQKPNIDYIYSQLSTGITPVDAYSALQSHKDEYLYFRTDHHWTGLGAYYAYTAFCEAAGLTPMPLSNAETRSREGFLGTLYSQTQDSLLAQNPDRVDYYILPTRYTAEVYQKDQPYSPTRLNTLWGEYALPVNSYSIFLHGDWPLLHINTEHKNGRRIVMVKESFGNAFAPFLIEHFEDVYVVDQRYFQTSLVDLINEKQITDLLFINNIFAANTQYHASCIERIAHQVWTPPEPEETEEGGEFSTEEAEGVDD